ncbi:MAG: ABC transporter substrate-binding protein, partial [Ardenticatenaceae bacterium]
MRQVVVLFLLIGALVACGDAPEPAPEPVVQAEQPTLTPTPQEPTATTEPTSSATAEPPATRRPTTTRAPTFT